MSEFVQPALVMERAKWKHECPICHGYFRDRGGIWTCDWCGFEPEWEQRVAMVRLGKSIEELAREAVEDILGFQGTGDETVDTLEGKGGHKPPRPDIQKMKDAYDFYRSAYPHWTDTNKGEEELNAAHTAWQERYGWKPLGKTNELALIRYWQSALVQYRDPQRAFKMLAVLYDWVMSALGESHLPPPQSDDEEPTPEGKKMAGALLKKYEERNAGMLYEGIVKALHELEREHPAAYKLFPWAVKQMKERFQRNYLEAQVADQPSMVRPHFDHLVDIVGEGGEILDRLRRENRLPQGFDINHLDLQQFEDWLMEWKRENVGSENAGEVVYEFKDGWTIQRLTTPEQLQFEGDEMGHCVGGYANMVGSGETIIYSLRDPKGMPHVTMEIEGLNAATPVGDKPLHEYNGDDAAHLFRRMEGEHDYGHYNPGDVYVRMHNPDNYDENGNEVRTTGRTAEWPFTDKWLTPHDDPKGAFSDKNVLTNGVRHVGPLNRTFRVVQVQGNANTTPKPEYQRKIKEFLDYLRSKGWKFERSDNWYAPHDDWDVNYDGEERIDDARDLDDWFDNHYKTHHEIYRGVNNEDAYGLPAERARPAVQDWERLLVDAAHSLVDEYDRSKWQGSWRDLAQAVWHAWNLDTREDAKTPEQFQNDKKLFLAAIQKVEDQLTDWSSENHWYHMDANPDAQLDKFKDLLSKAQAAQFNELVEQGLEEAYGETDFHPAGVYEEMEVRVAEEKFAQLWEQADEAVRDEVDDETYGDAYKFTHYLYMLAEKNGMVNPRDLPDPNERHGGLPSFEDLSLMPWKQDEPQQQQAPVEQGLPGAMSHWKQASVMQLDWSDLPPEHSEWLQGANDKGVTYATPGDERPDIRTPAMHYPREGFLAVGQPGWTHGDIDEALSAKGMQLGWGIEHAWHAGDSSLDVPPRWNVQEDSTFHRYFEPDGDDLAEGTSLVPQRAAYLEQVWPLLQQARPGPLYRGINMVREANGQVPIEVYPIDHEHNVWFDTDGNQRQRFRPGWVKNPETGKMEQTGELEDTFLDKHGRQGQGWVAYNGDAPVGSLTYVDDQGWHMIGTAYTHPDFRGQGIFNRLIAPLRETGRPIDAYVWENPWLKQKVRRWQWER